MPTRPLACALILALSAPLAAQDEPAPWETGTIDPAWADAEPRRTANLAHDPNRTDAQNGAQLLAAIASLRPGDRLRIGPGRWVFQARGAIDLAGTAARPIWIEGADPEHPPVLTRDDARQNVLNIGSAARTEYLVLRHLELTGGSSLVRLYDCHHVWIDQCELHHAGAEGITANTADTDHLHITRNHLHHFEAADATCEAMYLGANQGEVVMRHSVIAENLVHDCAGRQGDGIEVKQGSHHNWIVRNEVHDTRYPCILVYGTGGTGLNRIEANVCYRSRDNTLQVQGEAQVVNNLIFAGAGAGFTSTDHQGQTRDLEVTHNTIVTPGTGANLSSWNDRTGLVFANNVVFSRDGAAIRFPHGAAGVALGHNVVLGRVEGTREGFATARGIQDLTDVDWDAQRRDAHPRRRCPWRATAHPRLAPPTDLDGTERPRRPTPGALEPSPR